MLGTVEAEQRSQRAVQAAREAMLDVQECIMLGGAI
jgi:hypothetical protein